MTVPTTEKTDLLRTKPSLSLRARVRAKSRYHGLYEYLLCLTGGRPPLLRLITHIEVAIERTPDQDGETEDRSRGPPGVTLVSLSALYKVRAYIKSSVGRLRGPCFWGNRICSSKAEDIAHVAYEEGPAEKVPREGEPKTRNCEGGGMLFGRIL